MKNNANNRGYNYKWQQYRVKYLRDNPLCVECQKLGKITAASVIDHITPHKLFDAIESKDQQRIEKARQLFWNPNNHQALCKPCHDSYKKTLELTGITKGCDANGIPLDVGHHWSK